MPGPEMNRMLRPSVGSLLTLLELFREERVRETEMDFFLFLGEDEAVGVRQGEWLLLGGVFERLAGWLSTAVTCPRTIRSSDWSLASCSLSMVTCARERG
jgi:hypothetical protein